MGSMNGKVVLITGGASGIGAEVARRLHAKGANQVLTDLDGPALAGLAAQLGGNRVLTVLADVRDAAAMAAAAATPGPLSNSTSVQECAAAFVSGIEARKRRVYCPRRVGLFRGLRPVVSMPVAERDLRRAAPELMEGLDAEAAAMGRNLSARTEALEK